MVKTVEVLVEVGGVGTYRRGTITAVRSDGGVSVRLARDDSAKREQCEQYERGTTHITAMASSKGSISTSSSAS